MDAATLSSSLVAAAKRHDDALAAYWQATRALFNEFERSLRGFTVGGGLSRRAVLATRIETDNNALGFVIKSGLTNSAHYIGTNVLTFMTAGLGYHPQGGSLIGSVSVILSDGDFWQLYRSSKSSVGGLLVAGMISREYQANVIASKQRKMQSIENVTRRLVDTLWAAADQPTAWRNSFETNAKPVQAEAYLFGVVDQFFNPECKPWAYAEQEE